ncbi:hypothetical protein [Natrinema altunense]|uniref:hypothetical protein n=1 Tax=Natrinema altunense TaxID=222984 RepID=UPI00135F11BB|nr:hypothetical protein [Natrinema altunense]
MDTQKVLVEASEPAESGENREESSLGPEERAVNRYKRQAGEADNQDIYFGK